ncbi:MAG: TIGR02217 family protein [Rickettsiaceae bacterium]|nr:TIGR02217 family protein [Rickettsiaceae bacterium]
MNFHDIRLPDFITAYAITRPVFSTKIVKTKSGREIRSNDSSNLQHRIIIKNCILSAAEFQQFYSFFIARQGRRYSFRFRNYLNYQVFDQVIGEGDDKTNKFQLMINYSDKIIPLQQKITKPILKTLSLAIDSNTINTEVDKYTGIVTLNKPLKKGSKLTASFEYDLVMRFAQDDFDITYQPCGAVALSEIELIEVEE